MHNIFCMFNDLFIFILALPSRSGKNCFLYFYLWSVQVLCLPFKVIVVLQQCGAVFYPPTHNVLPFLSIYFGLFSYAGLLLFTSFAAYSCILKLLRLFAASLHWFLKSCTSRECKCQPSP